MLSETTLEWYNRIKLEQQGLDYFSRNCQCDRCSDNAICSFYKTQKKEKKKYKNIKKLLEFNVDLSRETSTPGLFMLHTNELDGKSFDIVLSCISLKFRIVGKGKWYRVPWPRLKRAIQDTHHD